MERDENPRLSTVRSYDDGPLKKLSVDLIQTYKHINDLYYQRKRSGAEQRQNKNSNEQIWSYDNDKHDLIINPEETWVINDKRYKIESILGKGSFGQVVKAIDSRTNEAVAIKVIKNDTQFYNQAQVEIKLLEQMAAKMDQNPKKIYHIVKYKSRFMYKRHLCLVFELLSYSLYDLIRNTDFKGVSLSLTRKFAQQLCTSLCQLTHLSIIHCDLKPENILLVNPKRSKIKLIDFGSSCKLGEGMYLYIQSRYYRSPEILLNLPYDTKIDMWSLGCILVELHTGEALFAGTNEEDQMMKIVEVMGMPPRHMLDQSKVANRFFKRNESDQWVPREHRHRYLKPGTRTLSEVLAKPFARRHGERGHSDVDYRKFINLLKLMLQIDPNARCTPADALYHNFFEKPSAETTSSSLQTSPRFSSTQDPSRSSSNDYFR